MNNQVHAPYHFVPLSRWVYLPEWAHLVSHDHPFSDGLSGAIHFELTNKTELLVGAKTTRAHEKAPSLVSWARSPDGKPIIPSSSLKGMLRSFLEVATFAKFRQVDDHRYAYRDISGADTKYSLALRETSEQAAWLRFNSATGTWQIRRCEHARLYGEDFNSYLKTKGVTKKIDNNDAKQNTLDKYKIWPLNREAIAFSLGERLTSRKKARKSAKLLGQGPCHGIPIFSGYRPGKSKDLDFNYMFYNLSDKAEEIDSRLVNQMFSAHEKELIAYLKEKGHPEFGIPIFIRESVNRNKKHSITALGLAKMPKMLYDKSVKDLANEQQGNLVDMDAGFDFCELLLGTLRDYGIGLKSRVNFSDALCTVNADIKESTPVILGQPQASYLNAYLEQEGKDEKGNVKGELTDYSKGAKLSGWKRYPAQQKFNAHLPDDLKNKGTVQSKLELLRPGAKFEGRIVFHNLKPEELGALLWALSPQDKFCHGLGHGKSLGAGAVQIRAKLSKLVSNSGQAFDQQNLVDGFVAHMNTKYAAQSQDGASWQNSTQIAHLLAFGDQEGNKDKDLTYMPLQKNVAPVTYAGSKVSGQRKALPSWQADGRTLDRREKMESTGFTPTGRLAELENKLVQDPVQLEGMEQAKKAQALAAVQAEKAKVQQAVAALKEQASPLFKEALVLQEHFEKYRGNGSQDAFNQVTARHAELTTLLEKSINADSGLSHEESSAIYTLAVDYELTKYFDSEIRVKELNKKQKQKHQQKQMLLEQLHKQC